MLGRYAHRQPHRRELQSTNVTAARCAASAPGVSRIVKSVGLFSFDRGCRARAASLVACAACGLTFSFAQQQPMVA